MQFSSRFDQAQDVLARKVLPRIISHGASANYRKSSVTMAFSEFRMVGVCSFRRVGMFDDSAQANSPGGQKRTVGNALASRWCA